MSNSEIKLFAGLTGADVRIEIFNKSMTSVLATMLGLKQFGQWNVQNEEVKIVDETYFRLRSFPILSSSIALYDERQEQKEITGLAYQVDSYDFRKFHLVSFSGTQGYLVRDCAFASYTAGFKIQGTVEVLSNSLVGTTLTVTSLGEDVTYSFVVSGTPTATQILAGATATDTATNIAAKVGGNSAGALVTLPLSMTAESSDALKLEVDNYDEELDELKLALSYMVAGAVSDKSKIEGISAFKIGLKSVNFRTEPEKSFTEEIVKKYLSKYKRALILSK